MATHKSCKSDSSSSSSCFSSRCGDGCVETFSTMKAEVPSLKRWTNKNPNHLSCGVEIRRLQETLDRLEKYVVAINDKLTLMSETIGRNEDEGRKVVYDLD